MKFKVYEYPIRDGKNAYMGSYTIKSDIEPLGYKGERLIQTLEIKDKKRARV